MDDSKSLILEISTISIRFKPVMNQIGCFSWDDEPNLKDMVNMFGISTKHPSH